MWLIFESETVHTNLEVGLGGMMDDDNIKKVKMWGQWRRRRSGTHRRHFDFGFRLCSIEIRRGLIKFRIIITLIANFIGRLA